MVYRVIQSYSTVCSHALLLIYKLEVRNIVITIVTNNLLYLYFFDQTPQLLAQLLFYLSVHLSAATFQGWLLFEGCARVYFVGKPADS